MIASRSGTVDWEDGVELRIPRVAVVESGPLVSSLGETVEQFPGLSQLTFD